MITSVEELTKLGILTSLDRHLADALMRVSGEAQQAVRLGIALTSRAVREGHVCIHIPSLKCETLQSLIRAPALGEVNTDEPESAITLPDGNEWLAALRASALVATQPDEEAPRPLVLDDSGRLYLFRYANYQQRLSRSIVARLGAVDDIDAVHVAGSLERLFGQHQPTPEEPIDLQRLAALAATRHRFTIISGGPGTGKTHTVAQLLCLLWEGLTGSGKRAPRIELIAPTGKAAQRLGESLQRALSDALSKGRISPELAEAIPRTASTIHRALGYQPRTPTRFRHDARHPLAADIVVVDEASMVDLALMSKLFDAVAPHARLILLGDKDQLASVEAGAILGDICNTERGEGYSKGFRSFVAQLTGERLPQSDATGETDLRDCMIHLTRSRRYGTDSALGHLAKAINEGNETALVDALDRAPEVQRLELCDDDTLPSSLVRRLLSAFRDSSSADPLAKVELLSKFRVLCAHRKGAFGSEMVNTLVQKALVSAGLIRESGDSFSGRPIMITANDYQLGLFNGDVGVLASNPDNHLMEAHFIGSDGEHRRISQARLPDHETVFAMTVHKSQGSEFDSVALLLPRELSPVLTRELIYTGVTRARRSVSIFGDLAVLKSAIGRRVERASGLRDSLWPPEHRLGGGRLDGPDSAHH